MIIELYELLAPYLCLDSTVNVWVLDSLDEQGKAKLVNAENDVVFWAPALFIAPLKIR